MGIAGEPFPFASKDSACDINDLCGKCKLQGVYLRGRQQGPARTEGKSDMFRISRYEAEAVGASRKES